MDATLELPRPELRIGVIAYLVAVTIACAGPAATPADIGDTTAEAAAPEPDTAAADAPTDTAATDSATDATGTALSPLLATGTFTDVSHLLGVTLPLDPGDKATQPPKASVGWLGDVDQDGLVDFVLIDGQTKAWLGHAAKAWDWSVVPLLTVKEQLRAVAATDGNGDGQPDIVLVGTKLHLLERAADGTWSDVATARGFTRPGDLSAQAEASAVVPVDLDNDGTLDLVVAMFGCTAGTRPLVFLNRGDGHYEESAQKLGIWHQSTLWQAMATDLDGDRHTDLLTMSEGCEPKGGNGYFHNRGFVTTGARFEAQKLDFVFFAPNTAGGSPMGGSVGDIDRDGDLDYVFSEIGYRDHRMRGMDLKHPNRRVLANDTAGGNHLLVRQSDGHFASRGLQAGITLPLSETGQSMVSWSARLWDFDRDGWLDLLLTNGWDYTAFALSDEGGMRPVLFRNRGDATFAEVSAQFGLPGLFVGRSLALADVDGDGDLDALLGGQKMQPRLWRNDIATPHGWLAVRLQGRASNPWGLGARVRLQTTGGVFVAECNTHAPTATLDDPTLWFAVPQGVQVQTLTVQWPSGFDQQMDLDGKANRRVVVEEPKLVQLSARFVHNVPGAVVTVTAKAFDAYGGPPAELPPLAVNLAPGSGGTFTGPLDCKPSGLCTRTWKPPPGKAGEATFAVVIDGQELSVRPKVRYEP
jgi:hypothetical protein